MKIALSKKYNEQNNGWLHTSSINAPQKLFKYISINPSLNLKSAWVNQTLDGIWNGVSFDKMLKKVLLRGLQGLSL